VSDLNPVEIEELRGLRACAGKGRVLPGSGDEARLLELVRLEAGGARRAVTPEKWDRNRIQAFYGVGRRFTYEMEEIGTKMGIPTPWEDPVELGNWFAQARGKGLRRHPAPAPVSARIREAELAGMRSGPTVATGPTPVKSVEQPDLPVITDGESDVASTLKYFREKSHALQTLETQLRSEGRYSEASGIASELKEVHSARRQWEVSSAKIQLGDEQAQATRKAEMAAFAGELWQILRRAFLHAVRPEEKPAREAALNAAAAALPDLLQEHFGPAPDTILPLTNTATSTTL